MSVQIKYADHPAVMGSDRFGGGVVDLSMRLLDATAAGSRFFGNEAIAGSLETGQCGLCVVYTISDAAAIPKSVAGIVDVARESGLSTNLFEPVRGLLRNVCSLVVSVGYALKLPGVTTTLTARLAPYLPWGDAFVHFNDLSTSVKIVYAKYIGGNAQDSIEALKKEAFRLDQNQHKWEIAKHSLLGVTALITGIGFALGGALSAGLIFTVSVSAFALAMFAFFAKQEHNDFVMKHGREKLQIK